MSDSRPPTPPSSGPPRKRPPEPSWLDELRDRVAEWVDELLHPRAPVPVPVRRRYR